MVRILPVPPPPPDTAPMNALKWELAAPTNPSGPSVPEGNEVTFSRTGPGDSGWADQWLNPSIQVMGHEGIETGRQLFTLVPGPPPEGHGGYDFEACGPVIDRSTTRLALFWSNWYATTGAGQFRGEHVTIARIPPGSIQGYMPTDPGMEQSNNARALPNPWDAGIVLGAP